MASVRREQLTAIKSMLGATPELLASKTFVPEWKVSGVRKAAETGDKPVEHHESEAMHLLTTASLLHRC